MRSKNKSEENNLLETGRQSAFAWIGKISYRYRRWVIGAWVVLLLINLTLIPQLDRTLKGTGLIYAGGEAKQTELILQQELKIAPDSLTLVFQQPDQHSLVPYKPQMERVLAQIEALPNVRSIERSLDHPEFRNQEGSVVYSLIQVQEGSNADAVIDQIQQVLTTQAQPSMQTYLVGQAVFDRDAQQISKEDLVRAELITLPLTLLALLVVFSSAIAAMMPLAMGLMAVTVTLGLLSLVALKLEISIFALNITTMLGLGIGIDSSLLMVNRFREELRTGSVEQAVIRTTAAAGEAVFYSGITTCIGLVSLLLFPIVLLRSLGIAGALVVLMSVMAALTLVPALLGIVGHGINRWRIVRSIPEQDGVWRSIAQFATRHAVVAIVLIPILIAVLASPFLNAQIGLGDVKVLPQGTPARQGVEVLESAFPPGEITPILLAVSTTKANDSILAPDHVASLYNFVQQLETNPQIAKVNSLFNLDPRLQRSDYQQRYRQPDRLPEAWAKQVSQLSSRSTTLISVNSRAESNDPASRALVQDLRSLSLEGLQIKVGGQAARQLDTMQIISSRIPIVFTAIISITFIALCILFRSIVLPIKAIILNLLSIGASFGALVFVFQEGHLHRWLHFTPLGYLDILLPVILFCVLFGLSMDYEVFMLTRIKEAYDRSGKNSLSIVEGLERTGRIITSAALLMIIVAGSFALTRIIFVKALGLGIALAVLIDSTLIRAILLPASMHLLGKWNWWMPKFSRFGSIKLR